MEHVRVLWEAADAALDVDVPSSSRSAVCVVKRALAERTQVPAECQRLEVQQGCASSSASSSAAAASAASIDAVSLPLTVRLTVRSRSPSRPLVVQPFEGDAILLQVDAEDSVLDVRFLLAAVTRLPAEAHVLALPGTGVRAAPLPDALRVADAPAKQLRVWFELEHAEHHPGYGLAHRTVPRLVKHHHPHEQTLQRLFRWSVGEYRQRNLLGLRSFEADGSRGKYEWQTFAEVGERVSNVGSGFRSLGLRRGESVGIMGVNRREWAITDWACMCHGLVSVTLYDTLGPDVVEFIVNHAEVRLVVVERAQLKLVTDVIAKCPALEFIVVMDDHASDRAFFATREGAAAGHSHRFSDVEAIGKRHPLRDVEVSGDDLASICYTSGTTGQPKGAMLTHTNLTSALVALNTHVNELEIAASDTTISYLPLAHIYERLAHLSAVAFGIGIGYYQGDNTKLVDDVAELAPSFFPGVPRVWQKIYDRINAQVAEGSFVKRKLFEWAFNSKLAAIEAGDLSSSVWDKLVFSKIAEKFGGNLRLMVSGSAPISTKVATFMKICFQSYFIEGYGLTETCTSGTLTPLSDVAFGHVGVPTASMEVMLVDVPEMEYLNSDEPCARGEIWLRGHSVFKGYFKQPEATAESMTKDGWFMTGDIGKWREDGRLQIIDRKKNIFKLAQGEYIRPEYIENVYKQSPLVANIFVYGDSLQRYLVAIVVPDFEALGQWAAEHDLASLANDSAQLAESPRVHLKLANDLNAIGRRENLRGFERVRKFKVVTEDFSVENDLLTPSMKLKRHEAKKRFAKEIQALYADIESKL